MPTDRARQAQRRQRRFGCIVTSILLVLAAVLGVYGVGRIVIPRVTPEMCRISVGDTTLSYDPDQTQHAATIAAIGVRRGLPERAVVIALATAMQESKLRNLDHGDRDSLGLFQQRPSQGWGSPAELRDPVYATEQFYHRLVSIRGYQNLPLTEVAQKVQRSGYPDAYAQHEDRAQLLARAFTGAEPAAVTCRLDPPTAGSRPAEVADDMQKQLGVSPSARGNSVEGVLDTRKRAWAAAHWAVAHASRTGIVRVEVGGRSWVRGKGSAADTWSSATTSAEATQLHLDTAG